MAQDIRSVFKDIEAGKIAPVYFFYGDEPYPIEHLVRHLLKTLDPSTRDFNCDRFDGGDADIEGIIAIARSYPMMSERRIVLIRDLQKCSTKDRNRLLDYVKEPVDSTCLILISSHADRRQKFWSALTAGCIWVESKTLYENQAVQWVMERVTHSKAQITQDAAKLLVEQVGTSLWNLHQEIEKLMTFVWGKSRLTRDDVIAVVGLSREYNPWELTDAVARRETKEALHILASLIESRTSAVGLIMDLTRRILILARLKLCMEQAAGDQLVKQMGLRPYFIKLFSDQARRFSFSEIQDALEALHQADESIKSGLLDPATAMTLIVYDITQKKEGYFKR
jgi:DNA polymerase-3 subunit delta